MQHPLPINPPANWERLTEEYYGRVLELREVLAAVDHTLTVHGHIDANTDLHKRVQAVLNG